MKHSTFYKHRGVNRIYTTVKPTDYHAMLRAEYDGKTYRHDDNDKLYFIYPSMPLDKPLFSNEEIK